MRKNTNSPHDNDGLDLTYEEIMKILEEELYNMQECGDDFKPLDFHDDNTDR
jgi:hypothetical protein